MKCDLFKIATLAGCLLAGPGVLAVPVLQLDSPEGTYDPITETTISTTESFDLWALGKAPAGTYYLTAVVTPKVPLLDGSFGSFTIDSTTYSFGIGNLLHGAPPNPIGTHDNLFPSYYALIAFTFGSDTVAAYDVETGTSAGGVLSRKTFDVDISGLADGFGLHFDLFNYTSTGDINKFAPFSHDAAGTPGTSTLVPDGGATVLLLGLGVLGLAAMRRK